MIDEKQVRSFIIEYLGEASRAKGVAMPAIQDTTDLLAEGFIDSMGFVELIAAMENRFDCEVDFGVYCSDDFSTLGGLVAAAVAPCAV